jgi:hypothetical protein
VARNIVETAPRWIFLAGISFFGLFVFWLSALVLACLTVVLSLALFAIGDMSYEQAHAGCKVAGPASSVVEKSPLLETARGDSELAPMASAAKSFAILIHSTCDFLSDYSRLQQVIGQEGQINEKIGDELQRSLAELIGGVAKASEISGSSADFESSIPALRDYRKFILALDFQSNTLKKVIPLLLHAQVIREDEHWFIGFQNLSEARSTGGMISNYAILRLGPSGWQIVESGTNLDLLADVPLGIPDQYKSDFGVIGADPEDWRDLNSISDNFLILNAISKSWAARSSYSLDGALFVGQGLAAQLVAATGDIRWRGTQLDAQAFFEFLSGDFYEFESDKEARTRDLAIIFDQAVDGLRLGELSPTRLARYLSQAKDGDWLQIYPSSPGFARALGGSEVRPSSPQIDISFNNVGANKLDRYSFLTASICSQPESKDLSVTVEFENRSPRSGLPPHVSPLYTDEKGNAVRQGTARIQIMIRIPNTLNLTDFESSSGLEAFPVLEFDTGQVFVLETVIPPGGKISHVLGIQSNLPIEGFDIQFAPMLNRPEITHRNSDCSSPAGGN